MGHFSDTAGTFSRAGQALLDILLDPGCRELNGVEKAKRAGISLRHYRRLMADISFQANFRAKVLEGLAPDMPAILEAAKKTALEPGRDGFKDREMLVRMGALYDPKGKVEVTGPNGGPVRLISRTESLSNEQLEEIVKSHTNYRQTFED